MRVTSSVPVIRSSQSAFAYKQQGLFFLIEFVLAYTLETTLGSPLSFKPACNQFDPRTTHPALFETAIVSATVGIICPATPFIAAWMYSPYMNGFHLLTLPANWLELTCFNFPFAWFSQLFLIQPIVRILFKRLFLNCQAVSNHA